MSDPSKPSTSIPEGVPLDAQAQKWYDYSLAPMTRLARSLAEDEGFAGDDLAEVAAAAERALVHAAASHRPGGPLSRPFWSHMLDQVYPAVFEAMRGLRARRGEARALGSGSNGGDSPGPQRLVSALPV